MDRRWNGGLSKKWMVGEVLEVLEDKKKRREEGVMKRVVNHFPPNIPPTHKHLIFNTAF